jgi:hypothetical protein
VLLIYFSFNQRLPVLEITQNSTWIPPKSGRGVALVQSRFLSSMYLCYRNVLNFLTLFSSHPIDVHFHES